MTHLRVHIMQNLRKLLQPNHDAEIGLIATACTLFISILAIPFSKYIFLLFFALLTFSILRNILRNGELNQVLAYYGRLFWPLLIVAATFVTAFVRTTSVPSGLAKEALAVFIILLFGLLFLRVLRTTDDLARFQKILTRQLFYLAAAIVALCMLKFLLVLNDVQFGPLMTSPDGRYPLGSSLLKDYNYFSLALLLTFTAGVSRLQSPATGQSRALQVLLALISVTLMFTSSRRGIIILLVINVVMYVIAFLHNRVPGLSQWTALKGNLRLYSLCMALALIGLFFLSSSNSTIAPCGNS